MSAAPASRAGVRSAMALAMALAAALRFSGLTAQSLWSDEVYSVEMTRWPLDQILHVQDGHPPLFALLHLLVGHVVDADVAGRLISAVAGVLAVGLLVLLATEMFDARTGWVAGVLLAISPLHVWYSQEGRSYALVTLLGVGASLALLRAVRRSSGRAWMGFALWSLAGLFTHYAYATLLAAQAMLPLAAGGQRRLLAVIAAIVTIGVACLPVLGPEATSFVNDQRGFEWLALPYAAFTYLAGFGLGPSVEELHRQRGIATIAAYWPTLAAVGALGLALVAAAPRALARAGLWSGYVLFWAIVPILLVFVGSWARDGAFNVRYAIVALPALVLMIAIVLTDAGTVRLTVGLAVLTALSAASITMDRLDAGHQREDVRAAARFLDANVRPRDRIIVSAGYMDMALRHYSRATVPIESLPIARMRSPEAVAANLRELLAPGRPIWLVLVRDWENDPTGSFRAALTPYAGAAERARFAGVTILRFPADAGPSAAGS